MQTLGKILKTDAVVKVYMFKNLIEVVKLPSRKVVPIYISSLMYERVMFLFPFHFWALFVF